MEIVRLFPDTRRLILTLTRMLWDMTVSLRKPTRSHRPLTPLRRHRQIRPGAAGSQGMGDWERDNALSATDVGHFTSTYAAQGGVDRTWRGLAASDDALVVGIVSSWTGSHVSYDNSPTTMRLDGPGVGVYGEYVRGGFSADLTTKFDFLQMKLDFAGVAAQHVHRYHECWSKWKSAVQGYLGG